MDNIGDLGYMWFPLPIVIAFHCVDFFDMNYDIDQVKKPSTRRTAFKGRGLKELSLPPVKLDDNSFIERLMKYISVPNIC